MRRLKYTIAVSAWLNGFLGIALGISVSRGALDWSLGDYFWAFGVSNLSGLLALLVVTELERHPQFKNKWFKGSRRIWPLFLGLYYGPLLGLVPALRDFHSLLWMILPLALGNGFCILVFGPIQDRLVARAQKKDRERKALS